MRSPIPTWCFSITVVRRGDEFLLVQERKHGQTWYLPAGRVEPGETFEDAAVRETLEETSVPVRLLGILRFEHSPKSSSSRMRVIFLAEPIDETPPKQVADEESLRADWVTLARMSEYALRGREVQDLCGYVAAGAPVFPINLLQQEGSPFNGNPPE